MHQAQSHQTTKPDAIDVTIRVQVEPLAGNNAGWFSEQQHDAIAHFHLDDVAKAGCHSQGGYELYGFSNTIDRYQPVCR